jgi:methylamine dehydrogenase heavy chain
MRNLSLDVIAFAAAALLTCGMHTSAAAAAAFAPDAAGKVASLPATPSPHWVWINDIDLPHLPDGRAVLVDGDSGRFLGSLSTGFSFERIVLSRDGKVIFSPEAYFARGSRGARTDVVTLYDTVHLAPLGEIAIPAKRSSNFPTMANAELTDDGQFLLIYNFTPAQSITVVNTQTRQFVGEIETAGCALAYPTGARSFFSICADGTLLDVRLNDAGAAISSQRTAPMFDTRQDPVAERPVRLGDTWLFVSFGGVVYPIVVQKNTPTRGSTWSLLTVADRAQHWRPGGTQELAVHAAQNRLFVIMHQGGLETHKDDGKDVWVYDLTRHARVQSIALRTSTGSIQVTRDAKPLLFSISGENGTLSVYDATSGEFLRSVDAVATTPTLLITP